MYKVIHTWNAAEKGHFTNKKQEEELLSTPIFQDTIVIWSSHLPQWGSKLWQTLNLELDNQEACANCASKSEQV